MMFVVFGSHWTMKHHLKYSIPEHTEAFCNSEKECSPSNQFAEIASTAYSTREQEATLQDRVWKSSERRFCSLKIQGKGLRTAQLAGKATSRSRESKATMSDCHDLRPHSQHFEMGALSKPAGHAAASPRRTAPLSSPSLSPNPATPFRHLAILAARAAGHFFAQQSQQMDPGPKRSDAQQARQECKQDPDELVHLRGHLYPPAKMPHVAAQPQEY